MVNLIIITRPGVKIVNSCMFFLVVLSPVFACRIPVQVIDCRNRKTRLTTTTITTPEDVSATVPTAVIQSLTVYRH